MTDKKGKVPPQGCSKKVARPKARMVLTTKSFRPQQPPTAPKSSEEDEDDSDEDEYDDIPGRKQSISEVDDDHEEEEIDLTKDDGNQSSGLDWQMIEAKQRSLDDHPLRSATSASGFSTRPFIAAATSSIFAASSSAHVVPPSVATPAAASATCTLASSHLHHEVDPSLAFALKLQEEEELAAQRKLAVLQQELKSANTLTTYPGSADRVRRIARAEAALAEHQKQMAELKRNKDLMATTTAAAASSTSAVRTIAPSSPSMSLQSSGTATTPSTSALNHSNASHPPPPSYHDQINQLNKAIERKSEDEEMKQLDDLAASSSSLATSSQLDEDASFALALQLQEEEDQKAKGAHLNNRLTATASKVTLYRSQSEQSRTVKQSSVPSSATVQDEFKHLLTGGVQGWKSEDDFTLKAQYRLLKDNDGWLDLLQSFFPHRTSNEVSDRLKKLGLLEKRSRANISKSKSASNRAGVTFSEMMERHDRYQKVPNFDQIKDDLRELCVELERKDCREPLVAWLGHVKATFTERQAFGDDTALYDTYHFEHDDSWDTDAIELLTTICQLCGFPERDEKEAAWILPTHFKPSDLAPIIELVDAFLESLVEPQFTNDMQEQARLNIEREKCEALDQRIPMEMDESLAPLFAVPRSASSQSTDQPLMVAMSKLEEEIKSHPYLTTLQERGQPITTTPKSSLNQTSDPSTTCAMDESTTSGQLNRIKRTRSNPSATLEEKTNSSLSDLPPTKVAKNDAHQAPHSSTAPSNHTPTTATAILSASKPSSVVNVRIGHLHPDGFLRMHDPCPHPFPSDMSISQAMKLSPPLGVTELDLKQLEWRIWRKRTAKLDPNVPHLLLNAPKSIFQLSLSSATFVQSFEIIPQADLSRTLESFQLPDVVEWLIEYRVKGHPWQLVGNGLDPKIRSYQSLALHDILDVCDKDGQWLQGEVQAVKNDPIQGRSVNIHYLNWATRYDEWITVTDAVFTKPYREGVTRFAEKYTWTNEPHISRRRDPSMATLGTESDMSIEDHHVAFKAQNIELTQSSTRLRTRVDVLEADSVRAESEIKILKERNASLLTQTNNLTLMKSDLLNQNLKWANENKSLQRELQHMTEKANSAQASLQSSGVTYAKEKKAWAAKLESEKKELVAQQQKWASEKLALTEMNAKLQADQVASAAAQRTLETTLQQTEEKLEAALKEVKDQLLCLICFDRPRDTLMTCCNSFKFCEECVNDQIQNGHSCTCTKKLLKKNIKVNVKM